MFLWILQGGGVYIDGGTVSFETCAIHDNKAGSSVCAFSLPIEPMGCFSQRHLDSRLFAIISMFGVNRET